MLVGVALLVCMRLRDVAYTAASGQQLVSFHNDYLVTIDTLQNISLMFESYTTEHIRNPNPNQTTKSHSKTIPASGF